MQKNKNTYIIHKNLISKCQDNMIVVWMPFDADKFSFFRNFTQFKTFAKSRHIENLENDERAILYVTLSEKFTIRVD